MREFGVCVSVCMCLYVQLKKNSNTESLLFIQDGDSFRAIPRKEDFYPVVSL